MLVSNDELRGKAPLEMAEIQQYVNFADQELLPAVATWVFPTLGLMQYNKQVRNVLFTLFKFGYDDHFLGFFYTLSFCYAK